MKKILTLLLVLMLSMSCFAGCGGEHRDDSETAQSTEQPDSNEQKNDSNVVSVDIPVAAMTAGVMKLANGCELTATYDITIKPVFDEYNTEEDFIAETNGFLQKQSDGTYKLTMLMSGISDAQNSMIIANIGNTKVTDVISVGGTAYINMESIVDWFASVLNEEIEWPFENAYIDSNTYMELIQSLQGTEDEGGIDGIYGGAIDMTDIYGMFGIGGTGEENVETVITALMNSLPMDKLLVLVEKIQTVAIETKAITADTNSISFKIDKTNIKDIVIGIAGVVRSDIVDFIDSTITSINSSADIPKEVKDSLTGFDKEEVQTEINSMLSESTVNSMAEMLATEIGESRFYMTFEATDTGVTAGFDILIDNFNTEESNLSQMGMAMSIEMKAKTVTGISAPSNIMTEDEISILMSQLMSLSESQSAEIV